MSRLNIVSIFSISRTQLFIFKRGGDAHTSPAFYFVLLHFRLFPKTLEILRLALDKRDHVNRPKPFLLLLKIKVFFHATPAKQTPLTPLPVLAEATVVVDDMCHLGNILTSAVSIFWSSFANESLLNIVSIFSINRCFFWGETPIPAPNFFPCPTPAESLLLALVAQAYEIQSISVYQLHRLCWHFGRVVVWNCHEVGVWAFQYRILDFNLFTHERWFDLLTQILHGDSWMLFPLDGHWNR